MKTISTILSNQLITTHTFSPLYSQEMIYPNTLPSVMHTHEFFEMSIILDGYGIHNTPTSTEILAPGSVYMIPIGAKHSLINTDHLHAQNIYILPRLLLQDLEKQNRTSTVLKNFILQFVANKNNSIISFSLNDIEKGLIELSVHSYNLAKIQISSLMEDYRYNVLHNIIILLCDAFQRSANLPHLTIDKRIFTLLNHIQSNIEASSGNIIDSAHHLLNLNPQYINQLVKQEMNTTLTNLIIENKVEKSCEYLLQDYPITEIAQILGFYDHSHYNKYFIRYYHITPKEYKSKYQGK